MDATSQLLASAAASARPPAALAALAGGKAANLNPAAAKKAALGFESFFLSQAFESMYSGTNTDPLFGGGNGESVYRSMLLQQYSKVAADTDSTGIAAAVEREILQAQEVK